MEASCAPSHIRNAQNLAQRLYVQYRDSQSEYKTLSPAIRRLRNVLEEADELLAEPATSSQKRIDVHDALQPCKIVLQDLSSVFHPSQPLDPEASGVDGLQARLSSAIQNFSLRLRSTAEAAHELKPALQLDTSEHADRPVEQVSAAQSRSPPTNCLPSTKVESQSTTPRAATLSQARKTWLAEESPSSEKGSVGGTMLASPKHAIKSPLSPIELHASPATPSSPPRAELNGQASPRLILPSRHADVDQVPELVGTEWDSPRPPETEVNAELTTSGVVVQDSDDKTIKTVVTAATSMTIPPEEQTSTQRTQNIHSLTALSTFAVDVAMDSPTNMPSSTSSASAEEPSHPATPTSQQHSDAKHVIEQGSASSSPTSQPQSSSTSFTNMTTPASVLVETGDFDWQSPFATIDPLSVDVEMASAFLMGSLKSSQVVTPNVYELPERQTPSPEPQELDASIQTRPWAQGYNFNDYGVRSPSPAELEESSAEPIPMLSQLQELPASRLSMVQGDSRGESVELTNDERCDSRISRDPSSASDVSVITDASALSLGKEGRLAYDRSLAESQINFSSSPSSVVSPCLMPTRQASATSSPVAPSAEDMAPVVTPASTSRTFSLLLPARKKAEQLMNWRVSSQAGASSSNGIKRTITNTSVSSIGSADSEGTKQTNVYPTSAPVLPTPKFSDFIDKSFNLLTPRRSNSQLSQESQSVPAELAEQTTPRRADFPSYPPPPPPPKARNAITKPTAPSVTSRYSTRPGTPTERAASEIAPEDLESLPTIKVDGDVQQNEPSPTTFSRNIDYSDFQTRPRRSSELTRKLTPWLHQEQDESGKVGQRRRACSSVYSQIGIQDHSMTDMERARRFAASSRRFAVDPTEQHKDDLTYETLVSRSLTVSTVASVPRSLRPRLRPTTQNYINDATLQQEVRSTASSPGGIAGMDGTRIASICRHWQERRWKEADAQLVGQLESYNLQESWQCARRIHHLLGVSASFQGQWQRALTHFVSVLDTPVKNVERLDKGDFAALYWLGDTYAMLNRRTEASLAYSLALQVKSLQGHTGKDILKLLRKERDAIMLGNAREKTTPQWWNDVDNDYSQATDSLLNRNIVDSALIDSCLSMKPEKGNHIMLEPNFRSRISMLNELNQSMARQSLHTGFSLSANSFLPGTTWPLPFDPFFSIGNVINGRLCENPCDLLNVLSDESPNKLPKVKSKGPSRFQSFTCNELPWLIKTIRRCLTALEMRWTELASGDGIWFVARFAVKQSDITTANYFSISLFRTGVRSSGYGAELCADGLRSARVIRHGPEYLNGAHFNYSKRLKKVIKEYLTHEYKNWTKAGKKDATFLDQPVMPTGLVELADIFMAKAGPQPSRQKSVLHA